MKKIRGPIFLFCIFKIIHFFELFGISGGPGTSDFIFFIFKNISKNQKIKNEPQRIRNNSKKNIKKSNIYNLKNKGPLIRKCNGQIVPVIPSYGGGC